MPGEVIISDAGFYYAFIVKGDVIQINRYVRKLIDLDFTIIPPDQIGNILRWQLLFDPLKELSERLFCRVSADNVINLGIANKFLMEIGR